MKLTEKEKALVKDYIASLTIASMPSVTIHFSIQLFIWFSLIK